MSRKIIVCTVFAVMSSLMVAGPASAAHCQAPEGEEPRPGFSFFGTDFVQKNGAQGAATAGASNCNDTPGKNDQAPNK